MSETYNKQTDTDWMCLNCLCMNLVSSQFLKYLGKNAKIGNWPVIFLAILIESRFFNRGETRADLKCEGQEPSESVKLNMMLLVLLECQYNISLN